MSKAAIDAVAQSLEGLRAALDGNDPGAIDAAGEQILAAISHIGAIGAWRADEAMRAQFKGLLPLIESSRIKANILSDHARQRVAMLADHGASAAPMLYGR